jgi:hypothetical protein
MLTKARVVQLLIMLIVLMGLFFWRTFDINAQQEPTSTVEEQQSSSLLGCDYQKPCEFFTEQGTFSLDIKNLPVKAEQWIDFELHTPMQTVQISTAKIVGKSMFMGRIPVSFKRASKQRFTAKALVGACTTAQMIWSLEITVENGGAEQELSFDFMVTR